MKIYFNMFSTAIGCFPIEEVKKVEFDDSNPQVRNIIFDEPVGFSGGYSFSSKDKSKVEEYTREQEILHNKFRNDFLINGPDITKIFPIKEYISKSEDNLPEGDGPFIIKN